MNTNTSELVYQGDVDIKFKVNGKTIDIKGRNAGTPFLKYIFAKSLIGEYDSNEFCPGFIAIFKQSGSGVEPVEFTKQHVPITGTQLVDVVDGYATAVTFTAYINFDLLQSEVEATDTSKYWFYLFPRTGNTALASIAVTAVQLSYIAPGTTATVSWTMRIINYNEY